MRMICFRLALVAAVASATSTRIWAAGPSSRPATPHVEFVSRFDSLDDPKNPAPGLSGLSYSGKGDLYFAVSDARSAIFRVTVETDRETGRIGAVKIGDPVALVDARGGAIRAGMNNEGCAFVAETGVLWIADEGGAAPSAAQFRAHDATSGKAVHPPVAPVAEAALRPFLSARVNLSFESLTRNPADGSFWSANEESLPADAAASTQEHGSVVRLVKFDKDFRCLAQYPYVTEPVPPPSAGKFDRSGVADLCALPDGRLLVLERATSLAGFRTRIFLADTSATTDVSKQPFAGGLAKAGAPFTPAQKTPVFDQASLILSTSNFEGMCLGPRLADGSRLLLLVADNNGGKGQSVQSLRVILGSNGAE